MLITLLMKISEDSLLFCRYTGNTSDALKCFNKTRSIPLWGQISLCHMIEICINPENENFSENVDVDADVM